jgi:hypothetical protein
MGAVLWVVLATSILLAGASQGAVKKWSAEGIVVARNGSLLMIPGCLDSATVGAAARLDFAFDDAAADLVPADPTWGAYAAISTWEFRFPSVTDSVGGTGGGIQIYENRDLNGVAFMDLYQLDLSNLTYGPAACAATTAGGQLQLYDETLSPSAAIVTDAQPSIPPDVSLFTTTREMYISGDDGFGNFGVIQIGVTAIHVFGSSFTPVMPNGTGTSSNGNVIWYFSTTCIAGCWFDPPMADGYVYETDGASRFTSIDDFPTGFGQPFEVVIDSGSLGTFGPGDSVDFSGEPGGGVLSFTILGITPDVDASDPEAFPLQLSLDVAPATFTMTSVGAQADLPLATPVMRLLLIALISGLGLAILWRRGRAHATQRA